VAGLDQRLRQEFAQALVVFGQKYVCHGPALSPNKPYNAQSVNAG
jgi:hypothetical protein